MKAESNAKPPISYSRPGACPALRSFQNACARAHCPCIDKTPKAYEQQLALEVSASRRRGRVAEGTRLLNEQTRNGLEGSNPSVSAIYCFLLYMIQCVT